MSPLRAAVRDLRGPPGLTGGRVTARYLTEYPLPTIADVPALGSGLVIELVARPEGLGAYPPTGAGEPAVTAATAATANAAAIALGEGDRAVRRLPVRSAT